MLAVLDGPPVNLRVFIGSNKLVAFTQFTGNLDSVIMPIDFSPDPAVFIPIWSRRGVQTGRWGPWLATRSFFARFGIARSAGKLRY
jgi:hypothetical protein